MSRLISLFVAIPLFLYPHVRPAAQAPPWGADLGAWVGRYPSEREAGRPRRLLRIPAVRKRLNVLLNSSDLGLLDSVLAVEKPVTRVERFIVVEQCKPHDCPSVHAMVVLDSRERRLWVGIFERTRNNVSTRWYGPTDHLLLPAPILESFRLSHTAE